MEEVEGAGRGGAYGKWGEEVVPGGIVKIKNRRKGRRRKGASPGEGGEPSLGYLGWSARPRWRHKSPASQTQIPSPARGPRVSIPGRLQDWRRCKCPKSPPAFPRGGRGGALSLPPSEERGKRPRGCPGPVWLSGQAWTRELLARPPHPVLSRSRQRGGAGHLETKTS